MVGEAVAVTVSVTVSVVVVVVAVLQVFVSQDPEGGRECG